MRVRHLMFDDNCDARPNLRLPSVLVDSSESHRCQKMFPPTPMSPCVSNNKFISQDYSTTSTAASDSTYAPGRGKRAGRVGGRAGLRGSSRRSTRCKTGPSTIPPSPMNLERPSARLPQAAVPRPAVQLQCPPLRLLFLPLPLPNLLVFLLDRGAGRKMQRAFRQKKKKAIAEHSTGWGRATGPCSRSRAAL